jgi:hypothetical protein
LYAGLIGKSAGFARSALETATTIIELIERKRNMNSTARTVLIVILVLLLLGMLPVWPYSSGFGYYPVGGVGLLVVIVLVLLLAGKL